MRNSPLGIIKRMPGHFMVKLYQHLAGLPYFAAAAKLFQNVILGALDIHFQHIALRTRVQAQYLRQARGFHFKLTVTGVFMTTVQAAGYAVGASGQLLLRARQVRKMIATYVGENK